MNTNPSEQADSPDYTAADRRPLKTRERGTAKRAAQFLAEHGVSANVISVAGMFAGLGAGGMLIATGHADPGGFAWRALWLLGAAFVQLRLLANMFDGMVALAVGTASRIGELYNEVPDRVSDTATLVGLGYAAGSSPALGWAAAAVALFVAYVRAVGKCGGAPQAFHGPMAKPHRMFAVTLTALLIAALPTAWTLHLAGPGRCAGLPHMALGLIILGGLFTAVRRLRFITAALHDTDPPHGNPSRETHGDVSEKYSGGGGATP